MPTPILMPALSPTMEEGTLAKWLVKKGDTVSAGDVIAEIETDKATMEVEAVDEGKIGRILVEEGTEGVAVNKPIAVLLEEGEGDDALEGYDPSQDSPLGNAPPPKEAGSEAEKPQLEAKAEEKKAQSKATSAKKQPAPDTGGKAPPAPETSKGERIFASPLARRIAAQQGIDLTAISGSGPRGRIVKADLEGAPKGAAKKADAQTSGAAASGPMPSVDPRAFYEEGSYEEM
ncbi:MAG: E3 binding domain-containing protein, partial [Parvibaculum sp.]|nr:E3 binding domain-containing protein [Parvibaculum sp.]